MLEGPFRVGPWPGLTPSGAGVLLGCAVLLGAVAAVTGDPRRAMPDLPILAVTSIAPLLLATRIVNAPGAASAVCGAYLLPRALLSLFDPGIEPPPLLLVPAVVLDLALWLRAADLRQLARPWPPQRQTWRKRTALPTGSSADKPLFGPSGSRPKFFQESAPGARFTTDAFGQGPRRLEKWRLVCAGAAFGVALSLVEPPFALLLGADASAWNTGDVGLAAALAAIGGAVVSAAAALV